MKKRHPAMRLNNRIPDTTTAHKRHAAPSGRVPFCYSHRYHSGNCASTSFSSIWRTIASPSRFLRL